MFDSCNFSPVKRVVGRGGRRRVLFGRIVIRFFSFLAYYLVFKIFYVPKNLKQAHVLYLKDICIMSSQL
jgi:hypothetical protein